jgi:hypothetical protein
LSDTINGSNFLNNQGKELKQVPGVINGLVNIDDFVNLTDMATVEPPDHVPNNIAEIFQEGATCFSLGCNNAAGTMFRLCIDKISKSLLPEEITEGLNHRTRRDLGLRLPWLFDNGRLPENLRDLSMCVKEDGNDGAHAGTLTNQDAEDLLEFTVILLERIYTEPERVKIAQERRESRRANN